MTVCKDCEKRPTYDPHSDYCQECSDDIDRMVRGWWEDDVAEGRA